MTFHFIQQLKSKASHLALYNIFENLGLSIGAQAPDRLIVRPADLWIGDDNKARTLLDAAGVDEKTGPYWPADFWEPESADEIWMDHIHGFGWLRDLRALGGRLACRQGQVMIESWIEKYGHWHKESWHADLIGKRLSLLISHYDYFCAGIDEESEEKILTSILRQARHLYTGLGDARMATHFSAIKGLIYSGLALEGHEKWIDYSINTLERALERQILPDGTHASRSTQTLVNVLEEMLDIKAALKAGDYPIPDFIDDSISAMAAAVRFFRCGDRKLSTLQGTQENDSAYIDCLLAQAGIRGKPLDSLPYSGFERVAIGRSLLLIDSGKSPDYPYDESAHASPLAFEFSYGKERLFVSCGTHPSSKSLNEALRFTAAHNTAYLDYRNACEIRKDGHFGRKVTKFSLQRQDTKNGCIVEAWHDGYSALNGITHDRTFYLSDEGHFLKGEDVFSCLGELVKPVQISASFHLHPSITSSLTQSGEAILKMPGGVCWRFSCENAKISIEDSLYMGQGITPRKTKQILLHSKMHGENAILRWNLVRIA